MQMAAFFVISFSNVRNLSCGSVMLVKQINIYTHILLCSELLLLSQVRPLQAQSV